MWALVINGKIETNKREEFVEGLAKLIKDTDSELIGRIEQYQLAEYVDYQKVEVSDVKQIEVNNGTETERT